MSIATLRAREVYGYWLKGDRTPLIGEEIIFTTTADLGYTDENTVAQRPVVAVVDSTGRYSAQIWCDEDSHVAIDWSVQFPKDPAAQSAVLPQPKSFSLAYQTGLPISIGSLLRLGVPAPNDPLMLYAAIDAYILQMVNNGLLLRSFSGTRNGEHGFWSGTLAEYNALPVKYSTTFYAYS